MARRRDGAQRPPNASLFSCACAHRSGHILPPHPHAISIAVLARRSPWPFGSRADRPAWRNGAAIFIYDVFGDGYQDCLVRGADMDRRLMRPPPFGVVSSTRGGAFAAHRGRSEEPRGRRLEKVGLAKMCADLLHHRLQEHHPSSGRRADLLSNRVKRPKRVYAVSVRPRGLHLAQLCSVRGRTVVPADANLPGSNSTTVAKSRDFTVAVPLTHRVVVSPEPAKLYCQH